MGPPGAHFGPPGAPFGPPGALLGLSWDALGTLWRASGELLGPPKASQIAPGGSRGGPPLRSLILAPFWDPFWVHLGTPQTSKNQVFVWRVLHFSKNREVRKRHQKWKPGYHGTGSALKARAASITSERKGDKRSKNGEKILTCLVLSCPVLSFLVLRCPVLSCLVRSGLVL